MQGCSYPLSTFRLSYSPGVSYSYQYVTRTILNEAPQHATTNPFSQPPPPHHHHQQQQQKQGARRDVGFMLSASVRLTPVWAGNSGLVIVKLQVTFAFVIVLMLKGVAELRSVTDHM